MAYVDIDAHHSDGVEHAFAADPSVLMISVHEAARWPYTGLLADNGCGNTFNLPVPRGFNDTEARAVLDQLILPRLQAFKPDVVVLQAGADGSTEDPLSRLCLSNNTHRAVLRALRALSPRLLLLGGGGYNPWSVGRCWAGLWAELSGQEIPDRLPDEASAILRALSWGSGNRAAPAEVLLTTLADARRDGPVRAEIRDGLARLSAISGVDAW